MMRDRLVNLIEVFCRNKYVEKYIPTQEAYEFFIAATAFADYLLANGVIVPPVKVGDVVYALWSVPTETKYIVYCAEVKKISQYKKNLRVATVFDLEPIEFRGRRKEYHLADFGKTVFFTREEAEQAMKGDKDINVLCKTEKGGEQVEKL